MPNTWVVVADSGSARIFMADSPTGKLVEREDYAHSESRVPERELVSDRKGQTMNSQGRRHAFSSEVSPQEVESRAFAKLLADRLEGARAEGALEHIVLVAAPEFLGKLRSALDAETRKHVDAELALNLTTLRAEEIRAKLLEKLEAAGPAH
jgi:protein required for attachment to host cells